MVAWDEDGSLGEHRGDQQAERGTPEEGFEVEEGHEGKVYAHTTPLGALTYTTYVDVGDNGAYWGVLVAVTTKGKTKEERDKAVTTSWSTRLPASRRCTSTS